MLPLQRHLTRQYHRTINLYLSGTFFVYFVCTFLRSYPFHPLLLYSFTPLLLYSFTPLLLQPIRGFPQNPWDRRTSQRSDRKENTLLLVVRYHPLSALWQSRQHNHDQTSWITPRQYTHNPLAHLPLLILFSRRRSLSCPPQSSKCTSQLSVRTGPIWRAGKR